MNLREATTAAELISAKHPHISRVDRVGALKALFGIVSGTSRKVESIETSMSGKLESVALGIDVDRFMLTMTKSFVLLTLQEGSERKPVIHKIWRRTDRVLGTGMTESFGTQDTYLDGDQLKWEHRYARAGEADELIAFNSEGNEALVLTLQTFK